MSTKLVVGLGNPGPRYETTRHNIGYLLVDELAERFNVSLDSQKFQGRFGKGDVLGETCYLLKPETFMNNSGQCVAAFMNYFKIASDDLVVIYDDVDMDAGRVKARVGGGHGGHNGIRDILHRLHDEPFHRVKVGVSRPEKRGVSDWVLGPLSEEELVALQEGVLDEVITRLQNTFQQMGHR